MTHFGPILDPSRTQRGVSFETPFESPERDLGQKRDFTLSKPEPKNSDFVFFQKIWEICDFSNFTFFQKNRKKRKHEKHEKDMFLGGGPPKGMAP